MPETEHADSNDPLEHMFQRSRPCTNGSTNCSTAPISTAPHASGLEVLRNSNGLRTMIAMMMAILSGDEAITIPMGKAQPAFADCPPDLLKP